MLIITPAGAAGWLRYVPLICAQRGGDTPGHEQCDGLRHASGCDRDRPDAPLAVLQLDKGLAVRADHHAGRLVAGTSCTQRSARRRRGLGNAAAAVRLARRVRLYSSDCYIAQLSRGVSVGVLGGWFGGIVGLVGLIIYLVSVVCLVTLLRCA